MLMKYKISKRKTGKRIRELMLAKGISVAQIQDKLDLDSPQAIYKWFNGTNLPTVENLAKLSRILGVAIENILVLEEGVENYD